MKALFGRKSQASAVEKRVKISETAQGTVTHQVRRGLLAECAYESVTDNYVTIRGSQASFAALSHEELMDVARTVIRDAKFKSLAQ